MATAIEFRSYMPPDSKALPDLFIRAIQTVYPNIDHGKWIDDLHDIQDSYLGAGGDMVVGMDGEALVAMGGIKRVDANTGEMKRVAVAPEYQGQGVGKLLLHAIESRAQELGIAKIILDTTSNQVAAQRLYEANGYNLVDQKPELAHPSGNVFDTLFYEKVLD
jgi:ribosomal protein S18 acetylase RimI-like enzyme